MERKISYLIKAERNCASNRLFFTQPRSYTVTSSENLLLSSRLITMACVLAWPDLLLDLSFKSASLLSLPWHASLSTSSMTCFEDVDTAMSLSIFFDSDISLSFEESCVSFLPSPFFSIHARHRFPSSKPFPKQR